MIPLFIAAKILSRHQTTVGALLLANPAAVNLFDATVSRDALARFVGIAA